MNSDQGQPLRVVEAAVLERFAQRIAENLEARPLGLRADAHREQLRELLARVVEMDYYELLGVEPGAPPDSVHAAFLKLARRVHPRHAEALGRGPWQSALELLFEKATGAYLVLTDAERSREYRELVARNEGRPAGALAPSGEKREEETAEVARRNFRLAGELAKRGDYHFAVELLHRSVLIDPRSEYYRLLADCQMENPRWYDKAIDNYRRALAGAAADADLHVALALACERAGRLDEAQTSFRQALELLPAHQAAHSGLARVQQRAREQRGGGALDRLFGWVKR